LLHGSVGERRGVGQERQIRSRRWAVEARPKRWLGHDALGVPVRVGA
jgi:hypothetical protein